MSINKINHLVIDKNDDGTYKISGKVNDCGFIAIPRAKIELNVEMFESIDNSNEKMCDINFN